MQTIKTYLYDNSIEVQILDQSLPLNFTTRNRVVYSRPIKVYQGIDNPIQILVRNQDQKKVNLTGYALQADIQDPTNKVTVNSYAVRFDANVGGNIAQGLGAFILDKDTITSLEQRFYKLTFKTINLDTNLEKPLYIDDNYGVPLDLQVLPAYYATTEPVPYVDNSVIDGGEIE